MLALATTQAPPPIESVIQAAAGDDKRARAALSELEAAWSDDWTPMLIELAELSRMRRARAGGSGDASAGEVSAMSGGAPALVATGGPDVRGRLLRFLRARTGQRHGQDLDAWRRWTWDREYRPHPQYARFKRLVYGKIDPRLGAFFPDDVTSLIRLDEIRWGGARVDGIPALDRPAHIPAGEADWLKEKHVVFGVEIDGQARAYPKRILAWHELARDRVGETDIVLVYCTLCGTVIPYRNDVAGRKLTFGTSGLLYRSNKLMYDAETGSLWSALHGVPLVGKLADFDVALPRLPVVTTTWGEWRARHPDTTVLSLDTGHDRNYAEGAAYRDYFRTDRLWYAVPEEDGRLARKREVLVMLFDGQPLAIDTGFLAERPVYHFRLGGETYVVLTSPAGASRVYRSGAVRIAEWDGMTNAVDAAGAEWSVSEEALSGAGGRLERAAAQRAFWFGWYAQFPNTALIGGRDDSSG